MASTACSLNLPVLAGCSRWRRSSQRSSCRPRTGVADHNPVEVTDPTGDSNGAPDITGVTVANDLSGTILFVVEVANRTDFVPRDEVLIYIDSDRSALTGFS